MKFLCHPSTIRKKWKNATRFAMNEWSLGRLLRVYKHLYGQARLFRKTSHPIWSQDMIDLIALLIDHPIWLHCWPVSQQSNVLLWIVPWHRMPIVFRTYQLHTMAWNMNSSDLNKIQCQCPYTQWNRFHAIITFLVHSFSDKLCSVIDSDTYFCALSSFNPSSCLICRKKLAIAINLD